ncbi:TonB-dependent receptor [Novosphingobium rosa]|uniref:TonB-dependent receptor n=1 Tax=Novosphingobium rosa TaxID=76978 RepID=UPI00082D6B48|nr:TonB-dependent receptor [Novosphingobium rosa]
MKQMVLTSHVSCAAMALAMALATPAMAQQAAATSDTPAAKPADDTLGTIVVTASTGARTKLETSTSISSLTAEDIKNFDATSTAELYRLIPGIQVAGTQGDGGNSNIGVRGLRTPTGGSPFVQIQEDGLPVVLFGDIQFGNNDYWTHPMPTDQRIEAIRGGTAATLASQAIGAVLNHISYTGRNEGGYVDLEKGVNYDWTKVNFRLGSSINDSTYFNIGGYYDVGHGILHAPYNVSNSYAIKGNITKEFADGNGYIRMLFKVADTQEPTYGGCVSSARLTGTSVSNIGPSALCDARKQAPNYSVLNSSVLYADASGNVARQPVNGISTNEKMLQFQTHYDFGNGLVLDDNARVARMKGNFNVQFYGATPTSGAVPAGQSLIYANGPNAGQTFTGAYVSASSAVHTNMNHMDHIANDLALSYKHDFGDLKSNLKLGYLYYSQRIAEDWHSNSSINEATGVNPAELDLVSGLNGTGNLLSAGGQTGFNQGWNQQFDLTFTDNAPYADLSLDLGRFNLDASVREEIFSGSGWAQGSTGNTVSTARITQIDPRTGQSVVTALPVLGYDGTVNAVNFSESATNWSVGALYKATDKLSVFTRASHGTRFNADRLTNSTPSYFNPNGTLSSAGLANSAFPVDQYEVGMKNRGGLLGGHYTVELTGYYSKYSISSQEISDTNCFNILGIHEQTCIIAGKYKDLGLELFSTYRRGGLNIVLSATYDHSRVAASQNSPFLKSPNIPDLTYSALVSYNLEKAELGMSVNGQTSTLGGDGNTYAGSALFGLFAKYRPVKHIQVGLDIYNLFNSYATQGAAGFVTGTTALVNAGVAQGRAIKGSVRFSF